MRAARLFDRQKPKISTKILKIFILVARIEIYKNHILYLMVRHILTILYHVNHWQPVNRSIEKIGPNTERSYSKTSKKS